MDDYDVVVDALEKYRDKLWEMTNRNMNSEFVGLNIMDDIRFYQIEQLDAAIAARKNKKEWVGLTEQEKKGIFDACEPDERSYVIAMTEALLKDKNS